MNYARVKQQQKENTPMKTILFVNSSPRGAESYSQQVARSVVDDLVSQYSGAAVVTRDLAVNPPPHLGRAFVGGVAVAPDQRTAEQAEALAVSDELIDEVSTADVVVLAAPMHNFGLPSTLKAWIDHVVRGGRTFQYSSSGPKGLLTGKRAVLVLASGGVFSDGPYKPFDFQEPYLRAVLGFIGITDVEVVRVEGVAVSSIGPERAVASAIEHSRKSVAAVA
jgi:FMN-dependent NADH-azoreductase